MNAKLSDQIAEGMRQKSTDDLLEIWQSNDRNQWTNASFEAIAQILSERGVVAPPQAEHIPRVVPSCKGVRGWLLLLCIGLTILGPIASLPEISDWFTLASGNFSGAWRTAFQLGGLADIALAALSIYAGLMLWRKKPGAVGRAKLFLWSAIGYNLISACLLYNCGLPVDRDRIIVGFMESAIAYLIWAVYLDSSKRVKATFDLH